MKRIAIVGAGGFAREVNWLIRDLNAEAWLHAPRSEVRKLLTRRARRAMYEAALRAKPGEDVAPRPETTSR